MAKRGSVTKLTRSKLLDTRFKGFLYFSDNIIINPFLTILSHTTTYTYRLSNSKLYATNFWHLYVQSSCKDCWPKGLIIQLLGFNEGLPVTPLIKK